MDDKIIMRRHFKEAFVSCYLFICGFPVGLLFMFIQALGLLFMLMFSGHIAGQQMYVEKNGGFFCLLLKVISCLTGKIIMFCTNSILL
jgi:hypothetical protein